MQVTVYHRDMETNAMVNTAIIDCGDRSVNQALEYAFFRTQNIDGSWSRPAEFEFNGQMIENFDYSEDVTVVAELPVSERTGQVMGLRSSMMGDAFFVDGRKFEVAMMGFKEC